MVEKIDNKLSDYFSDEEIDEVIKFSKDIQRNIGLEFDGFEKMTDLLNLLSPEKKQKMYGWSNYLLNLVQISKNLQNFLLYSAEKGISIPKKHKKRNGGNQNIFLNRKKNTKRIYQLFCSIMEFLQKIQ